MEGGGKGRGFDERLEWDHVFFERYSSPRREDPGKRRFMDSGRLPW
jgi:hypothetical protein